jgi:hypothetical protein
MKKQTEKKTAINVQNNNNFTNVRNHKMFLGSERKNILIIIIIVPIPVAARSKT